MSALPELLIFRHGETEWNREGRFQGSNDSSLTERGRTQAVALGALLGERGVSRSSHRALTSPQGRARETARLALGPLGIEATEDPGLVEIGMGCWTGLRRPEIDARWPGREGEGVLGFYARCPDGEGLSEVAGRAGAVLSGLTGPTVMVTHGITLRVLCVLAQGRPLAEAEEVRVPQGCLVRIASGRLEVIPCDTAAGLPAPTQDGSRGATGG